jgi:hypothetical protein
MNGTITTSKKGPAEAAREGKRVIGELASKGFWLGEAKIRIQKARSEAGKFLTLHFYSESWSISTFASSQFSPAIRASRADALEQFSSLAISMSLAPYT